MSRSSRTYKRLAGTFRADRLRKGGGIAPLSTLPRAPRELSETAKIAWAQIGLRAVGIGTLTAVDLPLLEETARTVATNRALEDALARDGVILESGSGARKAHPALAALASSRALHMRQLGQLGLTPMSRENLSLAPPAEDADPFAFLDQKAAEQQRQQPAKTQKVSKIQAETRGRVIPISEGKSS